jgi:hypothetical protein
MLELKANMNSNRAFRTQQEYYEDNKQKINEKKNERITCECGINYTRTHKARHETSKKHIDFINQIQK